MKNLLVIFALLNLTIASADESEVFCIKSASTIEDKLNCIKTIKFTKVDNPKLPLDVKEFDIQFEQRVDHNNPSLGVFNQKLVLLHRNESEPMVLQTSGYSIFGVREALITSTFETNQLQVEHRFFSTSTPPNLNWSLLDIKQSADDFHAIVSTFKQIYASNWVNTGGSKGGMTSVYHRRFYPNDLNGTVADVAPLSYSTSDQRYNDFINNVGGPAYSTCRNNLKIWQTEMLKDRSEYLSRITGQFTQLGSADVAFEHSVIESAFYFWQYGDPDDPKTGCQGIPINDSNDQRYQFLQKHAAIEGYADEKVFATQAYYYQASTQLGSPDNVTSHLESLRLYKFTIEQYAPKNVSYGYSNAAMKDVENWVKTAADKIIFVYGEFDPWTAGEFDIGANKNVFKFYVPKGNHRSKFDRLPPEQKDKVIGLLSVWLGKSPKPNNVQPDSLLEDIDLDSRQDLSFRL